MPPAISPSNSPIATIAVFFGGRSVEHDVSVLTGLQFIEAMDPTRYKALPVYIDAGGRWFTGDALLKRSFYPLTPKKEDALTRVTLSLSPATKPELLVRKKGLLGDKTETLIFDIAVPALHGSNGEDGTIQGLFSLAGVPFAGSSVLASATAMNKDATKRAATALGVSVLPWCTIDRPASGTFLTAESSESLVKETLGAGFSYPLIVKPLTLGSSIGVSKAGDAEALALALTEALRFDDRALVEPMVDHLVEYNVAVRRTLDGDGYSRTASIAISAIEQPETEAETLDFKNKYLRGSKAGGAKVDSAASEGMASLNRTLNPETLSAEGKAQIERDAALLFDALDMAGSVRLDFLSNAETGEIWFNEINAIPGSFAYFLWEAASEPLNFLGLTTHIIEEGARRYLAQARSTDAAQGGGAIFMRDN